jgi:hypothetical protein
MTTLKIHLATGFSLPAIFSKVYAINACRVESKAINKAANATVPHKQIKKIKSLNKIKVFFFMYTLRTREKQSNQKYLFLHGMKTKNKIVSP